MTTLSDERLIAALRSAMADEVHGHRLDREAALSAAVRQRPRRTHRGYAAAAAGIAAAAAVAVTYVATRSESHPPASGPAGAGCAVQYDVLPAWARDGFTDPKQVMPYVLSDKGDIIAILWSRDRPLNAPPLPTQLNKILWVSPQDGVPLVIHATLGDTTITRTVADGPGPSYVNMPSAGCWTFELSWGDNHDTMRLLYSP